jgi:hypothetical protein
MPLLQQYVSFCSACVDLQRKACKSVLSHPSATLFQKVAKDKYGKLYCQFSFSNLWGFDCGLSANGLCSLGVSAATSQLAQHRYGFAQLAPQQAYTFGAVPF